MKEKGMGRTRLGRLAVVTVPATVASLGFGLAITQGLVSASIASANTFQVAGSNAAASGLELSLRGASVATSDADGTSTQKKSALVTLKNGTITDLCMAVNQSTGITALPNIGLTIKAAGDTALGTSVDLNADKIDSTGTTTLPTTSIGVSEQELTQPKDATTGYRPGGFGMVSGKATGAVTGDVTIPALKAQAYGLTLSNGLSLTNLSIAPTTTTVTC